MDQRISLITLAVADRDRSREFYIDGLGWTAHLDVEDVIMIRVGERLLLSLWEEGSFEAEVGPICRGEGAPPITLAHNVGSNSEVDEVLQLAGEAGAPVWPAERRDWGGWSGYFADPDGYRWEVANAGEALGFLVPAR